MAFTTRLVTSGPVLMTSIWDIRRYEANQPEREGSTWHKAPFPKALAQKALEHFTLKSELVFDPFMGSGTTAVSAKKLGRHFFGCDISEEYVKLARKRVEAVQLAMFV